MEQHPTAHQVEGDGIRGQRLTAFLFTGNTPYTTLELRQSIKKVFYLVSAVQEVAEVRQVNKIPILLT